MIASNLGGTATLIGDPPNIMIGGATGLSFMAFIVNLAPIAVTSLVMVVTVLYLALRRRLRIAPAARRRVMELDAGQALEDRDELRRLGPILVAIIVAFFVHKPLGVEPATVALSGASVMLAVSRQPLEDALRGIDWPTLFFFLGLFVMVGALEATGAVHELAEGFVALTGGDRTAELLGIAGDTGDDAYWWALALGACFGGNLTLVAAAANVAAAGMAARSGRPIGFVEFLRVGVPATVLSMVLVTAYLLLRYA